MSGWTQTLTLAATAATGAAFYAWRGSKRVELTETTVHVTDLPPGLDGLRILHVADTHFPADGESLPRFLEAVRQRPYDIVVGTGDYADSQAGWDVALRAFRELEPGAGVFAVIGGHERYAPLRWDGGTRMAGRPRRRWVDPAAFVEGLREAGVRALVNEQTSAEIGGEPVRFVGVDDAYHGLDRLTPALPTEDAPEFRILLSHSPDGVPADGSGGFPLAFAGHTHGGQIRIPRYGAPVRHTRAVGRREASGLVRIGDTQVVISRGFGTTSLPLRFACPPELGIVELRQA